jgi:hypothetical protein
MDPKDIARILDECVNLHGLSLPLTCCWMSVQGVVHVMRFAWSLDRDRVEVETVIEEPAGTDFVLPIHGLITDTRGKVLVVVIEQPDRWRFVDLH